MTKKTDENERRIKNLEQGQDIVAVAAIIALACVLALMFV